tara:strand:- start:501 stop:779 length:279 start_codon:yes stop_codon:yes gene_type:complete
MSKKIELPKNVSVPPKSYGELERYAKKLNVPISYVLRAAIPVALGWKLGKEVKKVIQQNMEDTKIKKLLAAKSKSAAEYDKQIQSVRSKFSD